MRELSTTSPIPTGAFDWYLWDGTIWFGWCLAWHGRTIIYFLCSLVPMSIARESRQRIVTSRDVEDWPMWTRATHPQLYFSRRSRTGDTRWPRSNGRTGERCNNLPMCGRPPRPVRR